MLQPPCLQAAMLKFLTLFDTVFCCGSVIDCDDGRLIPWPMLSRLHSTSRPFVPPQPAPQAGACGPLLWLPASLCLPGFITAGSLQMS
jgi:hypothetical protein